MYRKFGCIFGGFIAFSEIIKNSGIQVDQSLIKLCLVVNSVLWDYVIPSFKAAFLKLVILHW